MKRRIFVGALMALGVLSASAGMALAVSLGVGLTMLGVGCAVVAFLLGDEG